MSCPESSSRKIGDLSCLCNNNRITINELRVTKENKESNLEDRLIDFAVRIIYVAESLPKTKVRIRNSVVRPARNAFDDVRGNAMMDFSNQDASFIIGCVAWQAGIRLLKKDVNRLQLIHIVSII